MDVRYNSPLEKARRAFKKTVEEFFNQTGVKIPQVNFEYVVHETSLQGARQVDSVAVEKVRVSFSSEAKPAG